jgi:hypothetical protein
MCTLCSELDRRLDHCRRLLDSTTDQLTLNGIALLIEKYEADKHALHPDPPPRQTG